MHSQQHDCARGCTVPSLSAGLHPLTNFPPSPIRTGLYSPVFSSLLTTSSVIVATMQAANPLTPAPGAVAAAPHLYSPVFSSLRTTSSVIVPTMYAATPMLMKQ